MCTNPEVRQLRMGAVPAAVADNAVLHHHPVIPAHPDTAQDRLHITAHSEYSHLLSINIFSLFITPYDWHIVPLRGGSRALTGRVHF